MNDSVEIDNSNMYSRPSEKCPKCGDLLNYGISLHNFIKNCEKRITYPYMSVGESMHLECYIQHVIDEYLNSIMKK